ncbi:MAG: prepilin-type N-terminal cleavage/methylation domain-containing protein [Elusimicrobiaceae bacterium]|nr:prepilin-type N-terminal cleavage/methylation domain-containing protein [Elusimicrobiaceae bacterium]
MNQGFTLIELLVVVLIIGVLSAVALPQYQTAVERSRATEALTQLAAVSESMQRYHAQHEKWPTSFTKLDIDIPTISADTKCTQGAMADSKYYGGKNFCIKFANNIITAERLRANHSYKLTTTITVNNNGTYSTNRACTVVTNNDEEAQSYCYAIAGGNDKVNDF